MPLKRYQDRVLAEVQTFLKHLAAECAQNSKHPALDAWASTRASIGLAGNYLERQNGLGRDLPTICIKVPTGGGKTLLATQILGQIHHAILRNRNGTGLVLWVVPSDQIYKDTLKTLRDRRHLYRQALEFALSTRLEVWEKHDIHRLTPWQLANTLNVLLLKLPSTNRADRESLKFFRDSGGNIMMHFPPENEPDAHRRLKERVRNLDMLADDPDRGLFLVKTSLGNLVRLCEPAVILDEGHKATSDQARRTIETFNPSIVIELSATPTKGANILVRVSGQELLDEQMIKLPINVLTSAVKSWQDCLTQARDKRLELTKLAEKHYRATGRVIRPIVLVQVERTGKDQRESGFVHSEDVKEHLMQKLDVPEAAIAIKSSEKDDIEGIDLLDEGCPIEWIITRSALQEGWDCPFAYLLVSLNNTASAQSMTQLVGRVLRQPDVTKTDFAALNESYVFCLRKTAADITREVKAALEKEGYDGDAASVRDQSALAGKTPAKRAAAIRQQFLEPYRKPFEGKIYLPRFCVKNGKKEPEKLDYFRHLISRVDVRQFGYEGIEWDLSKELEEATELYYRISLGEDVSHRQVERSDAPLEADDQVHAWLIGNLPFAYLSHHDLDNIVSKVAKRLFAIHPKLGGKLALVKFALRDRIMGFIEREIDGQCQVAFKQLFDSKKLAFHLECIECRFEIPGTVEVRVMQQLADAQGDGVVKSLYDFIPDDLNEYEKSVALYLDKHPEVLWWYRNLVGQQCFAIQGYRRSPIYPDFVVQEEYRKRPVVRVLLLETKGKHLKGSEDTIYKRSVADYYEKAGHKVPWQKLAEDFADHQFRFQILDEGEYADRDWREDLGRLLTAGS